MSFWQGRKVTVTGCSGLIGGQLCKLLLEQGAEVTGYDTESQGTLLWHGILGKFPVRLGDIRNRAALWDVIKGREVIIHLAALSGVEASRQNPKLAWTVNVSGTGTVLDTCLSARVPGAVTIASSNHIYGAQERLPVKEDAPLHQLDTYSATKIAVDYMARSYAHNYRVPAVVIRNTNCFGPCDPHRDHIVPGTLYALANGKQPVIRSKGKTKKSYLHTEDVCWAYLAASEWMCQTGQAGEAFNVSDMPISVLDFVTLMCKVTGYPEMSPVVLGADNDQSDEWLDDSKLRTYTSWRPRWTLEEAVKDTYAWVSQSLTTPTEASASLSSPQALR